MKKSRIIDLIQSDILSENLFGTVTHLNITKKALEELINDFHEEFYLEYAEFGRKPSIKDVQDYIRIPIYVKDLKGQNYQIVGKQ